MKKILVVVDMQKDFVDGALGSSEAVSIVPNVVKKIKDFDGEIFVTFDTHYENYMNTSEGKKLPVPHCVKGTDGWCLDENIQSALNGKNYTSVEKLTFGSVDLPKLIKDKVGDSFELELVGLCTDICVVSNALILKASFPENEISVISDCCAGVTVESHNAALQTMKSCQINIKFMHQHPFQPLYDNNSKVLILGSFPSVKSREQMFFYGHPQNRFWKVVSAVVGAKLPETVDEKRTLLYSSNIALWDVIASCDITGSSDSSIKNVVANDLTEILKNSDIKQIFVNGKTAEKYYNKYIKNTINRSAICLPSTSPANAGWSLERLIDSWQAIKKYIA